MNEGGGAARIIFPLNDEFLLCWFTSQPSLAGACLGRDESINMAGMLLISWLRPATDVDGSSEQPLRHALSTELPPLGVGVTTLVPAMLETRFQANEPPVELPPRVAVGRARRPHPALGRELFLWRRPGRQAGRGNRGRRRERSGYKGGVEWPVDGSIDDGAEKTASYGMPLDEPCLLTK